VTETLQVEEAIQLHDVPKLLVEWSSPWEEFVTSIRPALSRSTARLAGEAPYGLRPYLNMFTTCAVEAFLIFVAIVLQKEIAQLRPYVAPKLAAHEIIYYSADELPRTEDLGGSQSGATGRAGGSEAHHRTQTIRVARGRSLAPTVVDAPNLKLQATRDAVANLLALRANPGPPPTEGLRSSRPPLNFPSTLIAPAPSITHDLSRSAPSLGGIVPPAPSVTRENALAAPVLNSTVIPPAPSVSREHTLVSPTLNTGVVAPAPNVSRDRTRSAPALSVGVILPAPVAVSHDASRSPVQLADSAPIPPPVSAPEHQTTGNPRLTLPAPPVIAPPPSTSASRDLRALANGSAPSAQRTVVPPPPSTTGNTSLVSNLLGKIFGTTDVVPPPPTVPTSRPTGTGPSASLGSSVIAPPPTVTNGAAGAPRTRPGNATSLDTNIVPPPPSVAGNGATAGRSAAAGALPATGVVPPPPSVPGTLSGSGSGGSSSGPGGTLLASNVVPPPPSLGGGANPSGTGRGNRGSGLGGPLDAGSVAAPPTAGGSGGTTGVVVSNKPGSKVGSPAGGGPGSLAMSPSGGDKPGLGGSGGGAGIVHGDGPGSGMRGENSGAGRTGTGHGSDPAARGGISPTAGPGGAGSASSGTPPVPGVDVKGGSANIVTLPSFASGGNDPSVPARSSVKEQQGPAITIVATSRSGGAFNFYGKLPGDNYTVYVDTSHGMVVMQFADPASAAHPYKGTLVGPQTLRADLPAGLPNSRMVVACILDASGNLKNLQVLEAGPTAMTAKVMAALPTWKFRPAMRGDQPIEVNAILGFGIDTNDR
jgi:hypothetical protein